MIAVDTNLLVYAHREDSPWHGATFECLAGLARKTMPWAIPWPCLHEFLAIVTQPRIYRPPSPLPIALEQVDAWLEAPGLVVLSESSGYWDSLRPILESGRGRRNGARRPRRGVVSASWSP